MNLKIKICLHCGAIVTWGWLADHVDYCHPGKYNYTNKWQYLKLDDVDTEED